MELYYYKDPRLNFGDDLNAVLWPRILSKEMYEVDDVVVVGIGSILTEEWLGQFSDAGKRVIVLGSGTSYDRPPRNIRDWSVQAVRGPLTASMIGMPDKAITDGAILLAAARDLMPVSEARTDIVFMPHHRSIRLSPWDKIARKAGLTFVTPEQPVEDVLAAFSRAKLIVTEAMHGAIVADTLRIPWIPVVISPAIDEFKWRDWCRSMEVPFEPIDLIAGHPADRRRYAHMAGILRSTGIVGHRMIGDDDCRESLERYFDRRFNPRTKQALLRAGPGRFGRLAIKLTKPVRRIYAEQAARNLLKASKTRSYLSEDRVFDDRLSRMLDAVSAAERFARFGD